MHQWSKSPVLTQDFTILAWFSMRPWASANFFALELLIRYEQQGTKGSLELPSSQYMAIATIVLSPGEKEEIVQKSVKYPYPLGPSCTIPQSIGEIARYIQVIWQRG